jgi:signal peptidase
MKKTLRIVKKVFDTLIFVVLIVSVLLLTFISFSPVKSLQLLRVMSGSMEPAIKTSSIVLVKQIPVNQIVKGDVINFETSGTSVTHRVYEIKNTDNKLTFITKGDANNIPDVDPVSPDQIKGKVIFNIPYLGYLYTWIKQPLGFLILIILPALFVIISEFVNIKKIIEAEAVRKYELTQKSKKPKKTDETDKTNKSIPTISLLLILGLTLSFSRITGTNSYFSAGAVLANNTFSTSCWTPPSVPVLTYPANDTFADSTWLQNPVMKWDSSTSTCTNAGQIVYQYESYYDSGLTQQAYSSAWLTDSSIPTPGTPDGTYYWHVRAKDSFGNTSTWSDAWKMTVDTKAPAVPTGIYFKDTVNNTDVACGGITSARNFDVYWNANTEPDFDHYEYISFNADGSTGPMRTFTTPYFNASWWTVPTEGTYGVQIRAVDKAGNKSDWFGGIQGISNSCQYTVDWTAPTVHLVFPAPGPSATSFQAIFSEDVKSNEASDPANYFLNNWPGYGGSGNLTGHADISYDSTSHTATITFTTPGWYISPEQQWGMQNIRDLAGNLQSVNPYTEYSTPMVKPITTDSGTDSNWHNSAVTVNFTCTDINGSGCKTTYYTTDGSDPTTASPSGNSVTLNTDSIFTIKYFSIDNAGNVENVKTAANTVKIDKTAPASVITLPANSGSYTVVDSTSWDGLIAGTAADNLSGVNHVDLSIYRASDKTYWKGSSWVAGSETTIRVTATGTTSWNYTLTDHGPDTYTITSHAVDNAGNVEDSYTLTLILSVPNPTGTPTPSFTPEMSPTPASTTDVSLTPVPTDNPSSTPTPTNDPSSTPTPTATPTVVPTPTDTPEVTASPTDSPTDTPTVTPSPTSDPTSTSTPSPSTTDELSALEIA